MDIPLYDLLLLQYPTITIGIGCQVLLQDHGTGDGPVIGEWNVDGVSKPSAETITSWGEDPSVQQRYQYALNKVANVPIYDQLDSIDAQSIRALRTNDSARIAQLEASAVNLRKQLLPTGA